MEFGTPFGVSGTVPINMLIGSAMLKRFLKDVASPDEAPVSHSSCLGNTTPVRLSPGQPSDRYIRLDCNCRNSRQTGSPGTCLHAARAVWIALKFPEFCQHSPAYRLSGAPATGVGDITALCKQSWLSLFEERLPGWIFS